MKFHNLVQEGREIRRVRLDSLREAVDKYPCVILLGDPGCGKTTALQHLAYDLADLSDRLPLPLRLSGFEHGKDIGDFIVEGWSGPESAGQWNWANPELAANLTGYLEAGRLFFLFDALNEMPHEGYAERTRALRSFINHWSSKGNRFVVTCRVLDYGEELAGLQRVEIQPINDEQIQDFLRNDLPGNWKDLWQQLNEDDNAQRSLRELARNPFMLSAMVEVFIFSKDRQLGRNRSELMTRFTEMLMEELARPKCPPDEWMDADIQRHALGMVAFEIQHREGFGTLVKTAQAKAVMPEQVQPDPKWPPVPSPPDQVLKLAASAHIIDMTGDRSSLRFYHQLLQEYFVACEMLNRDPGTLAELWCWPWLEKDMPKWKRPHRNYDSLPPPPPTNWEETTILAAGLMPEDDDQLVRALTRINPVIAGRCLNEGRAVVSSETRKAVVDQLLATISDHKVALRVRIAAGEVLGYLGDPRLGELVTVAAGKFLMGDDQDDDTKPQHKVFLQEYQIGKYPVTNSEFAKFIKAGGYNKKHWWTKDGWSEKEVENWAAPRRWDDVRFNRPNKPVVAVSWYECLAYCRWLSAKTGQPYRLPSEAEWEKAARGTDGRQYPWGRRFDPTRLNAMEGDQKVWCTTPVGIYPTGASSSGCQDLAGNAWEWTRSLWGEDIENAEYNYPYNPKDIHREELDAGNDVLRVLRGGSWNDDGHYARCAYRLRLYPYYRFNGIGFRVVVSPISAL